MNRLAGLVSPAILCYAIGVHSRGGKMVDKIRVAILEDHQSVVDGYLYRLGQTPEIEVVAMAALGEELKPMLADHPADVLILDVGVRTARDNPNPYPILQTIPELLGHYPDLAILVISMYNQSTTARRKSFGSLGNQRTASVCPLEGLG